MAHGAERAEAARLGHIPLSIRCRLSKARRTTGGADAMITRADLAKGEYRDQFDGGDFPAVVANSPEAAEIVIQPVIDAGFEIRSAERYGNAKGSARWETTIP